MPLVDPHDPVFRVNPPPQGADEPAPQPASKPPYDPTANPVWGPVFTEERQPRSYRVRPEAVWLKARDEYVRGFSAEAVCAEFGLGLSTFRQRARREGWRRSDMEETEPEASADLSGFPPEPEAAPPTVELADLAWRQAAQAIRRGRVYEARAWMRAAAELKALAREERAAARMADYYAKEAAEAATEKADAADAAEPELYGLHGGDGVQSEGAAEGEALSKLLELPDAPRWLDAAISGLSPPIPRELAAALEHTRRLLTALPNEEPP